MPDTAGPRAGPATRRLLISLALALGLYGLALAWFAYSFVFIPDGTQDPVFRLAGVPRKSQFLVVTGLLLACASVIALAFFGTRPWRSLSDNRTQFTLFFVLMFLNILAATAPTMVAQIHPGFLPQLFGYVALVLAVQAAVIFVALSWLRAPSAVLALFLGLTLVNFYAMYLVLLEAFHRLHTSGQLGILAIAFFALLTLLVLTARDVVPVRSLNAVLAITMVAPALLVLVNQGPAASRNGPLAAFDGIEFKRFPNVHIVTFDALSAPSLVSRYLKLNDIAYGAALDSGDVTVFPNAFSSSVPTKQFANSVMRLAHPGFAPVHSYFAGRTDGPLARVFRSNGYRVSTGYSNMYFGMKGPYISQYHPRQSSDIRNNTLCALAIDSAIKFFGFCDVASRFSTGREEPLWQDTVLNLIRRSNADGNRWLTFHHIGVPGHTSTDYRTGDEPAFNRYREDYRRGSTQVAGILEELITALRKDDARSILLVFGDHGPYLSRTATFEQDPQFFVQDRYGITAAVPHNEAGCGPAALKHYVEAFATPERILAGLIRCLSVDPQVIDAHARFSEDLDFKPYLYE